MSNGVGPLSGHEIITLFRDINYGCCFRKSILHFAGALIAFLLVSWGHVSNGADRAYSSIFDNGYADSILTEVQQENPPVGPQPDISFGTVGSNNRMRTMPMVLGASGESSATARFPGNGVSFLSEMSSGDGCFSSFKNLIKALDGVVNQHFLLTLAHENAHREYVIDQGGEVEAFFFNGTGGYVTYSGHISKAGFSAAGIEKEKSMAASYISALKRGNVAGPMNALFALYAKSAGLRYILSSGLGRIDDKNNDLANYSDETGVDINQVSVGLIADMLLDTDFIPLLKLAAGRKSTLNPWGIKYFYNLSETGPESGIRFSLLF